MPLLVGEVVPDGAQLNSSSVVYLAYRPRAGCRKPHLSGSVVRLIRGASHPAPLFKPVHHSRQLVWLQARGGGQLGHARGRLACGEGVQHQKLAERDLALFEDREMLRVHQPADAVNQPQNLSIVISLFHSEN